MTGLSRLLLTVVSAVLLSDAAAHAVIVAGPQGRNTAAPTGELAGSGWDLQGTYGDYLGTPISPNWFITAVHFGNAGSTITTADGTHALTGASFVVPGTDLVMRQVATPFSSYATIYNPTLDGDLTASDRLVVFGRGTARGAAYGAHGWYWGAGDHVKSWGTNDYAGTVTITDAGSGYAVGTSFITAAFDDTADPNEAALSVGDSGGGVFVNRNGVWKLAGINYGVDLFRDAAAGPDVLAAVYDARGLYAQAADGSYQYVSPAAASAVPQYWYASYVPASLGLITASPIPEPTTIALIGTACVLIKRRRSGALSRASTGNQPGLLH